MLHANSFDFTKLPVLYEAEIAVCGAGPAGVAAGLAAARSGRKTVLLEQLGACGGMSTSGLVPAIISMSDGANILAAGICQEIVDELAAGMDMEPIYQWQPVNPEILKRIYDEKLTAAGVKVYFALKACEVICEEKKITAIVIATADGFKLIKAAVFIDATGDGHLCAWAGAPFETGDDDGKTMSPSLCVQYAGVDWKKYEQIGGGRNLAREKWDILLEKGTTPLPEHHFVGSNKSGRSTSSGNLGHIYGLNCLKEDDLTRGYMEGRQVAKIIHDFHRHDVPGFEKSELVNTAALLSVRETRRISGDYRLCFNDYIKRASFHDEIGRFAYPVDIHSSSTDPEEQKRVHERIKQTAMNTGENYGIPYRALLPQKTENLLVAGRCISTDREMQSSIRVMACCFITGQAAGLSAMLALGKAGKVRDIDVKLLQSKLREQGAYIPRG